MVVFSLELALLTLDESLGPLELSKEMSTFSSSLPCNRTAEQKLHCTEEEIH